MNLKTNHIGLAELLPGDVIQVDGRPHIVEYTNECRARCLPLDRVSVSISAVAQFSKHGTPQNIAPLVDPSLVLERRGASGLKEFLASSAKRRRTNNQAESTTTTEQDDTMKRTSTTTTSTEAAGNAGKATSEGKLGSLLGFSVCSVIRRLASDGVPIGHVKAILKAQGLDIKDTTVGLNVSGGKCGRGTLATITKAQVDDLKASAPAPVEEVKAEKPAKAGRKAKKDKAAK